MRRTSFASMTCSVARSLELIGDWWTLLIIREAFYGTHRFGEFQANLGIAPNILTNRLGKLVDHGILHVVSATAAGKALDYRLTPKGLDLFPVIVAIAQWGDRHAAGPKGPPIRIIDKRTGQEIAPLVPRSKSGRVLQARDVTVVEAPGASKSDLQRFAQARRKQAERTPL
jgi:DNA-binding HxlR family transcriptional regulator